MTYVVIQNQGEITLPGIRLLGLSKKDASQIGQFGTGLKESIALMCRTGRELIIYSGLMRIDFSIQDCEGEDEICYMLSQDRGRYEANKWHGMGMHPDFGKADWTDDWMIFREILCNALDEGGVDMLHHDIISTEPEGVEGSTRVYISCDAGILKAYASIEDKLMMLGNHETITDVGAKGSTLVKKDNKKAQIYNNGVWVQENSKLSLFDYSLISIKLDESRHADWWTVNTSAKKLIIESNTQGVAAILGAILDSAVDFKDYYEYELMTDSAFHYLGENKTPWLEAWINVVGKDHVACPKNSSYNNKLIEKGFTPVIITDYLLGALSSLGVPTYSSVLLDEEIEFESLAEGSEASSKVYDEVWNMFVELGLVNGREKPPLKVFTQSSTIVKLGEYRNGVIYINQTVVGSPEEVTTLIEEISHHLSGAADESRAFQNYLLDIVCRMRNKFENFKWAARV